MYKFSISFWTAFLAIVTASAQEVLVPLKRNPALQSAISARISNQLDTLVLPFVDDFSQNGPLPAQGLWTDRWVYINTDMADEPPTLGVATFDGLDEKGIAYDIFSPTGSGLADRLTSQAIDLSNDDQSDSIYLSFFYQPAGLCDPPEANDSLTLEFWANDNAWRSVWRVTGSANDTFKQVMIPLLDSAFFHEGFRMRWSSYGNKTGNVDVWHLDYVRLNRSRNIADTAITDVAFRQRPRSMLQLYQEMPWKQFAADSARFKAANHGVLAHNLGQARNVAYKFTSVNLNNGSTVADVGFQNISPFPAGNTFTFNFPAIAFPSTTTDSLILETTYVLQNAPDFRSSNDTVRRKQTFWNHFAYDDGTAETGYGLNTIGGSVAYKFYTATPDTLRGVWMYFTQAAENASLELFNLKVWAFIGEGSFTGNEALLTQQPLLRPRYADSIGQFVFYALDTPVLVRDSFYVGWQQLTQKLLNIGLDRNHQVSGVKWFNTLGQWNASTITGSWMIRPVLATELRFPTAVMPQTEVLWQLYPNPTSGIMQWSGLTDIVVVVIRDIQGRLIKELHAPLLHQVDVREIDPGMYFISLQNQTGRTYTKRFIRQ